MTKKQESRDLTTDASAPCLKYTALVPQDPRVTTRLLTGKGIRSFSAEDMEKSKNGELTIFISWEDFNESCTVAQLIDYANRYGADLKKGMQKFEVSITVWHALCEQGRDVTIENAINKNSTTNPSRKKKLANRRYVKVQDSDLTPAELKNRGLYKLPPQATACLELFLSEGTNEVTETRMKELIMEKREVLNTKQDPWRIFQYYRPQLISHRYIRLV